MTPSQMRPLPSSSSSSSSSGSRRRRRSSSSSSSSVHSSIPIRGNTVLETTLAHTFLVAMGLTTATMDFAILATTKSSAMSFPKSSYTPSPKPFHCQENSCKPLAKSFSCHPLAASDNPEFQAMLYVVCPCSSGPKKRREP